MVKEKAEAREEDTNKVREREDGAIFNGNEVSIEESHRDKLMGSPNKDIPTKGKNKVA